MPSAKQKLGYLGEKIAKKYLKKQGYHILDQHFTTRWGEIDLIAQNQDDLVFIEVKSRRSTKFGQPEESITEKKLNHLIKAIYLYLERNGYPEKDCRVDAIIIFFPYHGSHPTLRHLKNIYLCNNIVLSPKANGESNLPGAFVL